MRQVLILGGTREAVWLAEQLAAHAVVVYSLAGRTITPIQPLNCRVHRGGFGGLDGLRAHLNTARYDLVIDATHPFAREISRHAQAACDAENIAYLAFHRDRWRLESRDRWHYFGQIGDLIKRLDADFATALVTLGSRHLEALKELHHTRLLCRMIESPKQPHFLLEATSRHTVLCRRPPYGFDFECALIENYALECLVTRHAGGQRPAKLDAAAHYALPVLMLDDQGTQGDSETPQAFLHRVQDQLER